MTFDELNGASYYVERALLWCCRSPRWATALLERRPFASLDAVLTASDEVWSGLGPNDWLEAMTAHPAIGSRSTSPNERERAWSAGEQDTAQAADVETMQELVRATIDYQSRFGYIFLISASGKDAKVMLDAVRQRMHNSRDVELRVAAEELRKITCLRLEKLLDGRAEVPQ